MLISDLNIIGARIYQFRKQAGFTQEETAERADISCRAYADIERGSTGARLETLVKICAALGITPDDLLTETEKAPPVQEELEKKLSACTPKQREAALKILDAYLEAL